MIPINSGLPWFLHVLEESGAISLKLRLDRFSTPSLVCCFIYSVTLVTDEAIFLTHPAPLYAHLNSGVLCPGNNEHKYTVETRINQMITKCNTQICRLLTTLGAIAGNLCNVMALN